MSPKNHILISLDFPQIPLKTAAALIDVKYDVLKQPSRRVQLGLVDSPIPSWSLDRRVRFVTVESINTFLTNKAIQNQISHLTPPQKGSS